MRSRSGCSTTRHRRADAEKRELDSLARRAGASPCSRLVPDTATRAIARNKPRWGTSRHIAGDHRDRGLVCLRPQPLDHRRGQLDTRDSNAALAERYCHPGRPNRELARPTVPGERSQAFHGGADNLGREDAGTGRVIACSDIGISDLFLLHAAHDRRRHTRCVLSQTADPGTPGGEDVPHDLHRRSITGGMRDRRPAPSHFRSRPALRRKSTPARKSLRKGGRAQS